MYHVVINNTDLTNKLNSKVSNDDFSVLSDNVSSEADHTSFNNKLLQLK